MAVTRRTRRPHRKSLLSMCDSFCSGPPLPRRARPRDRRPSSAAREPNDLPRPRTFMAGDCELRKWEEFMTTILAVNGFARIGRRSELGPGDGMMLRRRLIRSDEAWLGRSPSARPWACQRPPTISGRPASGPIARSATNGCRRRSAACTRPTTRATARGRSTNNWCARGTGSLVARSSG
jgi:hypothetical protein